MGARVFVKGRPCGWCVWGPGISSFVQNAGCHVPGQDRKEPSLSWHCQRSRFCVPWSKMIITGKMLLSTLFSASESWRNHIFFYSILTCYTREPKYHWMPLTVKTSVHLTGQNSPLFRWESWGRREAFGQRPFNRNRSRTYQSWHLWPPRFSSPIPPQGTQGWRALQETAPWTRGYSRVYCCGATRSDLRSGCFARSCLSKANLLGKHSEPLISMLCSWCFSSSALLPHRLLTWAQRQGWTGDSDHGDWRLERSQVKWKQQTPERQQAGVEEEGRKGDKWGWRGCRSVSTRRGFLQRLLISCVWSVL